ncbi:alanine aminotransferase [Planoprotostelium fungivorum]|uniref:Alanine aminotransferase n=1 Tax=Planoprotostelium fungivorum TaxID=1890364 RepID=A0A2P6NVF9_9EUKA|nr:alanine aminotransferase [Planoprotostelium fungivorum]
MTKQLDVSNIRPNVRKVEFRLKDEVVDRALSYKKLFEDKDPKTSELKFPDLVFFNVGDAHVAGQKPISFYRQVLAMIAYPPLMDNPPAGIPEDAVQRARVLHKASAGLGAYSGAQGLLHVRQTCAKFIEKRDGFASDANNIILTDGSYDALKIGFELLIRDERDTILIPAPGYPLYSAVIREIGGIPQHYFLEDKHQFNPQVDELKRVYEQAESKGQKIRAIVINNPGNPAGNVLSRETLVQLLKFAKEKNIVVMADEVYQVNAYDIKAPFVSLRKISKEEDIQVEMLSFQSTSKGFSAECGVRGGYIEFYNVDGNTVKEAVKLVSVRLSPNTTGQIILDLACDPPTEGQASYPLFHEESEAIMGQLRRKAKAIEDSFNSMNGTSCAEIKGSLFAFPQIHFSEKALQSAKEAGLSPDTFYASQLLDATGVCVSSGNIFGQKEGTYHIRLTLMPTEDRVKVALDRIKTFNEEFYRKYQ